MNESDYYARACKYYLPRAILNGRSMSIELKFTRDESIPFSCLMPHQEEKLLESERGYAHKIADVGMLKKPFDIILIQNAIAIVVVIFYKPRDSRVYEIPIRSFIQARETATRKSLTLEEAAKIGKQIYL